VHRYEEFCMFDVPTIFARRCGCLTLAACLASGGSAVA
jgi:hypothetical protein